MKIAIILGSSRVNGNTQDLVNRFSGAINHCVSVFDLSDYDIKPYDYDFNNQEDDFNELISTVILQNDVIIFASPVYWYSPSAQLKTFMDRLTDLLEINKPLGRLLKEKHVAVIATGSANAPNSCFEGIFSATFNYLKMHYLGMLYCAYDESGADLNIVKKNIENFVKSNDVLQEKTCEEVL